MLATNIAKGQALEGPKGKSTSGTTLRMYCEWWRDHVCMNAGIRLDAKRLFDASDRDLIRRRANDCCQVCSQPIGDTDAEFDHYPIPHRDGGLTVPDNGRLVHKGCHPRGRPTDDD
jgi:hypothetical protein